MTPAFKAVLLIGITVLVDATPGHGQECCQDQSPVVYQAVLDEYIDRSEPLRIVILDSTSVAGSLVESALMRMEGVSDALRADFLRVNSQKVAFAVEVDSNLPVDRISKSDILSLPRTREGRWAAFEARFPGAGSYVQFSRIGFNSGCDNAVVGIIEKCGDLCGSYRLIHLRRDGSRWIIVDRAVYGQS